MLLKKIIIFILESLLFVTYGAEFVHLSVSSDFCLFVNMHMPKRSLCLVVFQRTLLWHS